MNRLLISNFVGFCAATACFLATCVILWLWPDAQGGLALLVSAACSLALWIAVSLFVSSAWTLIASTDRDSEISENTKGMATVASVASLMVVALIDWFLIAEILQLLGG